MQVYFENDNLQEGPLDSLTDSINLNSIDYYDLDVDKIKTIEDVVLILRSLNFQIQIDKGVTEHQFKDIMHLLKKVN